MDYVVEITVVFAGMRLALPRSMPHVHESSVARDDYLAPASQPASNGAGKTPRSAARYADSGPATRNELLAQADAWLRRWRSYQTMSGSPERNAARTSESFKAKLTELGLRQQAAAVNGDTDIAAAYDEVLQSLGARASRHERALSLMAQVGQPHPESYRILSAEASWAADGLPEPEQLPYLQQVKAMLEPLANPPPDGDYEARIAYREQRSQIEKQIAAWRAQNGGNAQGREQPARQVPLRLYDLPYRNETTAHWHSVEMALLRTQQELELFIGNASLAGDWARMDELLDPMMSNRVMVANAQRQQYEAARERARELGDQEAIALLDDAILFVTRLIEIEVHEHHVRKLDPHLYEAIGTEMAYRGVSSNASERLIQDRDAQPRMPDVEWRDRETK